MSEAVEQEVVEEADVIQEALDSFNDDIDTPVDTDDFDTPIEEEVKEESTESDEKPVESEEVEEVKEEVKEETKEELHHLKHFNGDKDVTYDELIGLAQEGVDRGRIVGQRDEARAEIETLKNDPRLEVADRINKLSELYEYGDVNRLVDALYNSFDEQQGNEIGTTNNKIKNETEQAKAQAEADKQKPYDDFMNKFPDVKADDIPQEVWNKVNSGESILTAYESYINASKELEISKKESETAKELEALKAEIAILKKNTDNKTKTKTGSIEGKSDGNQQEAYLDIWDK